MRRLTRWRSFLALGLCGLASGCGTLTASAARPRQANTLAGYSLQAPSVEAHRQGLFAIVSYRFASGVRLRRLEVVVITVHPRSSRDVPSGGFYRAHRRARVAIRLPLGAGPYVVKLTARTGQTT